MGMIGVDKIGQIRRAFFERQLPIKEIVRTLFVSRATVRKVIRGKATEFRYERGVQPAPKLGEWVEVLTEIVEKEARLPRRERRSTQRCSKSCAGAAMMARTTACIGLRKHGGTSGHGFPHKRSFP
jgi:hypothetical protein